MVDQDQNVALVTGAARGIGQAVAGRLAGDGAAWARCDLRENDRAQTAGLVQAAGREARVYGGNVASADDVQKVTDRVLEDFGRLDILVNNAGITRDGLLARMTEEAWDAVLDVNLKGAFLFTKACGRIMMKQRRGAIVNMASVIGLVGNPGQANYAASKGGLIALTKSVARELGARNVRVNAVAPGYIQTRMTESLPETVRQKMLGAIPLGRLGTPEEVAEVVAFLASDKAAYITGQVLTVCGGMVT